MNVIKMSQCDLEL